MKLRRVIIIDVETTGLSPRSGDRVIEIGAVELVNGETAREFATLIGIDHKIHHAAQRVHGISSTMLLGQPLPAMVWPAFLEFIADAPLVAHNASFDSGFIRYELDLLGLELENRSICTVQLSRRMFPQLFNHRLETVARHILGGIPADCRLHRALGDARLLALIWQAMEGGE